MHSSFCIHPYHAEIPSRACRHNPCHLPQAAPITKFRAVRSQRNRGAACGLRSISHSHLVGTSCGVPAPQAFPLTSQCATARCRFAPSEGKRGRFKCNTLTDASVYQVPDADEDDDVAWDPTTLKAVVVGAGPTGLVAAHYLLRRGYTVEVYDKNARPAAGDSLSSPLFLSSRGNAALEELQLELMRGGMQAQALQGTWDVQTGTLQEVDSANSNSRLYVMDRSGLAEELIREAINLHPTKVTFHFGTELRRVSFKNRQAWFQPTGSSDLEELDKGTEVDYDLILGADGAESKLRSLMQTNVKDFRVQYPIADLNGYKTFHNLSLPAVPDAFLPGLQKHKAQEFLYELKSPGAPSITIFKDPTGAFHGTVSGVTQWQEASVLQLLTQAYPKLPLEWASAIAYQTCDVVQPQEKKHYMVQCNEFHAPRAILLGDAAHATTSVLNQGTSCAIESVRTLRLILRGIGDNLEKLPEIFTMYRKDAVMAMQFLEFSTAASQSPPQIKYNGGLFHITAFFAGLYWGLANIIATVVNKLTFGSALTVPDILKTLKDWRVSYSDATKMVRNYGMPPIILSVAAFLTYIWVYHLSVM